jgi:hypothetical protein
VVTTLGSGDDGAVRRIETAYDGQGNAYLITSNDDSSGGNIVDQVQARVQRAGTDDEGVTVALWGGEHVHEPQGATPTPKWPRGPITRG